MGGWLSRRSTFPEFLRFDGHYSIDGNSGGSFRPGWAEAAIGLTKYCSWIKFSEDKRVLIRQGAHADPTELQATWEIAGNDAVRLLLSSPTATNSYPQALYVEAGDQPATVFIYLPGSSPESGAVRFTYQTGEDC